MSRFVNYLTEAVKGESFNTDNIEVDTLVSALEDIFEHIDDLAAEVDISITPSLVRIISNDGSYYVEFDEVYKLAESAGSTEAQAFENILDYYSESGLTKENTFIVLTGFSEVCKSVKEASKGKEEDVEKAKNFKNRMESLKQNGIKVLKK